MKASELTTLTLDHESLRDVLEQLKRTPAGLDVLLARMVPCGVAFHHAGKFISTESPNPIEVLRRKIEHTALFLADVPNSVAAHLIALSTG